MAANSGRDIRESNRMPSKPSQQMERFDNPHPNGDYEVSFDCEEFTCICPKTGQPDFATIRIQYVPDQYCVELKSLKLYFWSYREVGAFHEDITNQILNDLVELMKPRKLIVEADFKVRGGIHTVVTCRYQG